LNRGQTAAPPGRRPVVWAAALLALIFALDAMSNAVVNSTAELGAFDEPAHLATTALILLAAAASVRVHRIPWAFALAALIASMAIDLDHIPQYLGWHGLTEGTPRPYSHSLLSVALFLCVGAITQGRPREVALGAAFGVTAHLLRDLATANGVALFWPFSKAAVTLPYAIYAAILVGCAGLVALRGREWSQLRWNRR
jgi:inner membrane protein